MIERFIDIFINLTDTIYIKFAYYINKCYSTLSIVIPSHNKYSYTIVSFFCSLFKPVIINLVHSFNFKLIFFFTNFLQSNNFAFFRTANSNAFPKYNILCIHVQINNFIIISYNIFLFFYYSIIFFFTHRRKKNNNTSIELHLYRCCYRD